MRHFSFGRATFTSLMIILAVLSARTAMAQAILAPGDTRLRSDLELLADSDIIRLPLMTWPIPLDMLTSALDGVAAPDSGEVGLLTAYWRVQRLVEERKAERSLAADASLSDHPTVLRTFEDTPRTGEDASLAASVVENHWDGTLKVGLAGDPQDGQILRFDGSYLQGVIANWLVGVYAVDRWWGPGWDGSLVFGNAARPIPALALSRRTAEAPHMRWLRWIGNWNAVLLVGKLDDRSDVASPEFVGMRLTLKPTNWLEMGVSHTIILCGSGVHCTAQEWLDKLTEQHAPTSTSAFPSVQLAGWDARVASPWRALPVAAYGQLMGSDAVGGFPDDYFGLFGVESWRTLNDGSMLRAHLEWANTSCRFYNNPPKWNCAYEGEIYTQGYRYRGLPIGDSLDEDAEVLSLRADLINSEGQDLSIMARTGALNRDPFGNPRYSGSVVRQQIRELVVGWRRNIAGHDLSAGIGALHSNEPSLNQSNNPLEMYLNWAHRL
jgi:hypothetical protein